EAIFGNLNLKLLHANACPETNAWGSTLIGRSYRLVTSTSSSYSPGDWQPQVSANVSYELEFEVQPRQFTTLRRGGRGRQVDAIACQGGRVFHATGSTWLPVTFRQQF